MLHAVHLRLSPACGSWGDSGSNGLEFVEKTLIGLSRISSTGFCQHDCGFDRPDLLYLKFLVISCGEDVPYRGSNMLAPRKRGIERGNTVRLN